MTQKVGQYTEYDASAGIYSSRVPYSPESASCIFEYLLGSVGFDDAQEVLRECASGRTIS
jgi:hypothetical protein